MQEGFSWHTLSFDPIFEHAGPPIFSKRVNSQRAARLRGRGIKPRPWQGDTPLTPGIRFPAYKAGLITLVK